MTARVFLSAEWRDLVVVNYTVDASLLAPLVPAGTELDDEGGLHYVSVVGFMFHDTRVLGIPVPWHRRFEEMNLRFYVRREVEGSWRRGVVFIREVVPRRAIAWTARVAYNEPYVARPMRRESGAPAAGATRAVGYGWMADAGWAGCTIHLAGEAQALVPGRHEAFILEHYWGYTRQRDGGTVEYAVHHPPWRYWPAVRAETSPALAGAYGDAFRDSLSRAPVSAFVAEGSPVTVEVPRRIA